MYPRSIDALRAGILAGVILIAMSASAKPELVRTIPVAKVWTGHPVGFALLTDGDARTQFVAFYDAERRMTVAQRALGTEAWRYTVLDEQVGWDSHNYIAMALDTDGHLHLSGNMHSHPLVYFRTREPHAAHTLERIAAMTGRLEHRVTYPHFMCDAEGSLIFTYRDGGSGNGNQIYNRYDAATRNWSRLLDRPLTDGEGRMNAYFDGPRRAPDGTFHLIWMWRDTGDCVTNHDLSYARSRDLVNWERSDGTPYELPIRLATAEVIEPLPPRAGLINTTHKLGFDNAGRPLVVYHAYDDEGHSQLYLMQRHETGWRRLQLTQWDWRWTFGGGGSIVTEVKTRAPLAVGPGRIAVPYSTRDHGSGRWIVDEATCEVTGHEPPVSMRPAEMNAARSTFPGVQVRWADDLGDAPDASDYYLLRWETLPTHRDRPREEPWPAPTDLEVVRMRDTNRNTKTR